MYEDLNNFEKALAHFGTRADIIIALEMGGKIDVETAYQNIKMELKEPKRLENKQKETRVCSKCEIEKPLDENHYQVVKYFKEKFSFYCNECNKPKPRD